MTEEQLATQLVHNLLSAGLHQKSTDIHLEPLRDEVVVRFRSQGALHEVGRHSAELGRAARRAVKRMFHGDPEEEHLTQDGRILFDVDGQSVDVRVSTFPTMLGERLVMRIQDLQHTDHLIQRGLDGLDLDTQQNQALKDIFFAPYGLVLVGGLIGSGRTETMYAALASLASRSQGRHNLISLEAPVETFLPGIVQTRVAPPMDFLYAIRASVRQDPDAVFTSRLPDPESARELLQAGLTGHLVAARVSSPDAAGALAAFMDLIPEPVQQHHLAMVFRGVCAQRMVWRLCSSCKQKSRLSAAQKKLVLAHLGDLPDFYQAEGCAECRGSGLGGRSAIYQIVQREERLVELLLQRASVEQLRAVIQPGLVGCAIRAAARGLTSLEEAIRATA